MARIKQIARGYNAKPRPPVQRKLSITRGSSLKNRSDSHVTFQEDRWEALGISDRSGPSTLPVESISRRDPRPKPIQHVDGTYLKHEPEEEHHSQAGNNICMVLDDKLMAQHWRILVGLLSDRHVDSLRHHLCFTRRRCSRFLLFVIIIIISSSSSSNLQYEDAQSSLLLPLREGPGSNWMACHSSASGRAEPLSRTNEMLLRTGEKQLGLSIAP